MAIFEINNLNFTYPQSNRRILEGINLTINEGDFVLLCGPSGCGKTTLLRQLKPCLAPHGNLSGKIDFCGVDINELDHRRQTSEIGFVSQNPDNQIVTDKVWHELAFGLESLGYNQQTIRLRVAEMASFFGIESWFLKDVSELSGGQKQLLNLASVMALQPKVLVLDEPTSQLDPIAAKDFLESVRKINQELGVSVVITEHRLEDVVPLADKIVLMEEGKISYDGNVKDIGQTLINKDERILSFLPSAMRIYASVKKYDLACPISVRDGRNFINQLVGCKSDSVVLEDKLDNNKPKESILELKDIYFKYDKHSHDVLGGLSMQVRQGEIYALLGGNGTGKSTTISIIAKLRKAYRGKVRFTGQRIGVLPQDPQSLFVMNSVEKELFHTTDNKEKALELASFVGIDHLLQQHPYDLSGGEQQRLALCKVLLIEPDLLVLDEPTKGLDRAFQDKLGNLLLELKAKGVTILMVSHDIEFCARFADTCALMFNGQVITSGNPVDFFAGASFYTTSANRMVRHIWPNLITTEGVIEACKSLS